jgi:hypothetical protein
MRPSRSLALAVLTTAWPAVANAYDDSWYQADFWGGEYPNGFGVAEPMTVDARLDPDPDAAAKVKCALPKGAVYHPWNHERVESDELDFRSYTLKETHTVRTEFSTTLYLEESWDEVLVDMATGATWTYLTYLGEGNFLMEYDGKTYIADDQALFELSTSPDESASDEWLHLKCANKAQGWLLLSEVKALENIVEPNIVGYGEAADLPQ